MRGAAELGDNSLWSSHKEQLHSYYTWSFFKTKILNRAALIAGIWDHDDKKNVRQDRQETQAHKSKHKLKHKLKL